MEITSEFYEQIEEVLDAVDYETIHQVMIALDWKWVPTENRVPKNLIEIRKVARNCLKHVITLIEKNDVRYHCGMCGFVAEAERFINDDGKTELFLCLLFSVSDVYHTTYGGYE